MKNEIPGGTPLSSLERNWVGFQYHKDVDDVVTLSLGVNGEPPVVDQRFCQDLESVLNVLAEEPSLAGVIIKSTRQAFCLGLSQDLFDDVALGDGQGLIEVSRSLGASLRRLENLPVPVVAVISGRATGVGLEISLACNFRVASSDGAVKFEMPEVNLGLLPVAGAAARLSRLIGPDRALSLLLGNKPVSGKAAADLGLVSLVTDSSEDMLVAAKALIEGNPDDWCQTWDADNCDPYAVLGRPRAEIDALVADISAKALKRARGLLPAISAVVTLVTQSLDKSFVRACQDESAALSKLVKSKQAKNIIAAKLIQLPKIKAGASRPKGIALKRPGKIGVVGSGMMGRGIALCAAQAGVDVVWLGRTPESAQRGITHVDTQCDKQIKRGHMTSAEKDRIMAQIITTTDYDHLESCELIIEAVYETMAIKTAVIKHVQPFLKNAAVFGSNTSTLPISELGKACSSPEKIIGIHFFSPVDKMPLVELICGEHTSEHSLAMAFDFSRQLGKVPIVVNDSVGFFTSRVYSTYMDEGARLLKEGVAPALIDSTAVAAGMALGPLAIMDEVSQSLLCQIAKTHREMGIFGSGGDTRVSTEVVERLVAESGRSGRYQGGGFYDYNEDGSKSIWPQLKTLYYRDDVNIPVHDIKDRLLIRQIIESLKCLEEGVLKSVADGNIGSLLGIAAPEWSGGYLQVVNTWEHGESRGLQAFYQRAEELASVYGDRFTPPQILQQTLLAGGVFT